MSNYNTKSEKAKKELSNAFFKYYVKSPKIVKTFARPIVKTTVRAGKNLRPYSEQARVQADAWIENNVKGAINKYIGSAQKRVDNVTSIYSKKKKK